MTKHSMFVGKPIIDDEALDYFRRRERIERKAAKNAISEVARREHQELALRYAEVLAAITREGRVSVHL
jgi:hypothetical protein